MGRESLDSSEAEGPGRENRRRTTDDRQDNRRPATDGRRQRPTADNRQPTGRRTTRRPTATTNRTTDDKTTDDLRQHRTTDDRRPNRRPTRRVKNKHNPRTSIPSGGYRAIGPTGGITVSERRHTSPEVGHGEGVKAGGVHPKRGRAVRKRFVLFCFVCSAAARPRRWEAFSRSAPSACSCR